MLVFISLHSQETKDSRETPHLGETRKNGFMVAKHDSKSLFGRGLKKNLQNEQKWVHEVGWWTSTSRYSRSKITSTGDFCREEGERDWIETGRFFRLSARGSSLFGGRGTNKREERRHHCVIVHHDLTTRTGMGVNVAFTWYRYNFSYRYENFHPVQLRGWTHTGRSCTGMTFFTGIM